MILRFKDHREALEALYKATSAGIGKREYKLACQIQPLHKALYWRGNGWIPDREKAFTIHIDTAITQAMLFVMRESTSTDPEGLPAPKWSEVWIEGPDNG